MLSLFANCPWFEWAVQSQMKSENGVSVAVYVLVIVVLQPRAVAASVNVLLFDRIAVSTDGWRGHSFFLNVSCSGKLAENQPNLPLTHRSHF
jgi:hypothetical protein